MEFFDILLHVLMYKESYFILFNIIFSFTKNMCLLFKSIKSSPFLLTSLNPIICQFMFSISVRRLHKCASSESVLTLYEEMNSFFLFLLLILVALLARELVCFLLKMCSSISS